MSGLIRACIVGITLATSMIAVADRPNVLVIISDDQSFPHASAYGFDAVQTPGFDEIAKSGVLFSNAIVPSPGCSPMRAAFLSGRNCWQCGAAGTHGSYYPANLPSFVDRLAAAGYRTGMTGKGWGPGKPQGRKQNPAGKSHDGAKVSSPPGISRRDYAANFDRFLDDVPDGQPFCFWMGGNEPHRPYDPGIGRRRGIDPTKITVPGFLPDVPEVRADMADYLAEIQWFDAAAAKAIERLKQDGLWENTLVIMTSDNGMPFPRAKANLYDFGIHVPLAISWPTKFQTPGVYDSVVSLLDVTATFYDATGVDPPPLSGHSLVESLSNPKHDSEITCFASVRDAAYSSRERHSSSRFNTLSYPGRCLRTNDFLYIVNERPERWPAGTPSKYDKVQYDAKGTVVSAKDGEPHGGYHDIDSGPTMKAMIARREETDGHRLWSAATDHRPNVEMYDLRVDRDCMNNLAESAEFASVREALANQLETYRRKTDDLRLTDPVAAEAMWENYPRMSSVRWFPRPDWLTSDASMLGPDWLESRRPKVDPKN